jgi:D-alanine-D-alanine ligase-like ATP-grasp enzyme
MKYATLPIQFFKQLHNSNLTVEIEPTSGFCARITAQGKSHFLIGSELGVNPSSASRVSEDKLFSNYFLKKDGLNTLPSYPIEKEEDLSHIPFSYPFILKPNRGLGGAGFLIIATKESLNQGYHYSKKFSPLVIAQPYISKPEYRLVVFNGKLYFAYERSRYTITGDGSRSIKQIIAQKNSRQKTSHHIDDADFRIEFELKKSGLDIHSIPKKGETVTPFGNANLSCGGQWRDVTSQLHDKYRKLAVQCASSLGLTFAGVDLFTHSISHFDPDYSIIEVNSKPGFEYLKSNQSALNDLFLDLIDCLTKKGPTSPNGRSTP